MIFLPQLAGLAKSKEAEKENVIVSKYCKYVYVHV